jgi:hypothetical protein
MNERDFRRMIRRAVLGVSAAPLLWLPGCGREQQHFFEFEPNASVIPNRDAGIRDAGTRDAGFDAGVDAGNPDGGNWTLLFPSCGPTGPVQTSIGPFYKDGGVMLDPSVCEPLCGVDAFNQPIKECTPATSWELICWGEFCAIGRLAEGIGTHAEGAGLGRTFADMAAHEAAAVVAFEQLAVELGRHDLPEGLRRGAMRAAREERRHTRLVGALSRRHGGRFALSGQRPAEVRSLEAIALDNAVEGCARETFGAMVGLYQSQHARDRSVRAVLASVAEDEIGHGSWSWALHQELSRRLSVSARRKIRAARDGALQTLTRGVLAGRSAAERLELGLPDEDQLEHMAATLRDSLYI